MSRKDIFFGLIAAIFFAMVISPFASQLPDGLEKVADDKGFSEKEVKPSIPSPIPGYAWPGLKSEKLASSAAGVAGTLIVFVITYGAARIIRRQSANS